MKRFRISLWMNGIQAIRSQEISGEEAEQRIEWWRHVYGQNANIKIEAC